ncbi:response regulator transcription factor [Dyadobacter sp. CY312]|uniref:response regulator transcription factor n=1 Tax=Dyadobacter sp. CY312 TaxID=2907303 RepID=UPI001F2E102F|nr:response regulator transcription factor [Dyadobacter sp. CY312]MCE7044351.1 response regulator transcription factor [Dyadobacter sp. CY312]
MIVALLDKYPVLRLGLRELLTGHFKSITTIESESIRLFSALQLDQTPDIIIMGLSEEGKDDHFGDVNMAKKAYPGTSLIVYADEALNLNGLSDYLSLGVEGYLSKRAESTELITCVSTVADGKKYVNVADLLSLLGKPESGKKEMFRNFGDLKLSGREAEIARYLADGKRPSWISQKLNRKPSTISTIKRNIFKKLAVNNVLELRERISQYDVP